MYRSEKRGFWYIPEKGVVWEFTLLHGIIPLLTYPEKILPKKHYGYHIPIFWRSKGIIEHSLKKNLLNSRYFQVFNIVSRWYFFHLCIYKGSWNTNLLLSHQFLRNWTVSCVNNYCRISTSHAIRTAVFLSEWWEKFQKFKTCPYTNPESNPYHLLKNNEKLR